MDTDKPKSLMELLTDPRQAECEGYMLKLADELSKDGYNPRYIAEAALAVALRRAKEQGEWFNLLFLRDLQEHGRSGNEAIDRFLKEKGWLKTNNPDSPPEAS